MTPAGCPKMRLSAGQLASQRFPAVFFFESQNCAQLFFTVLVQTRIKEPGLRPFGPGYIGGSRYAVQAFFDAFESTDPD